MKFAFVFPGQGSQSIGMMNGYIDLPIIKETFQEASDILKRDFWSMISAGSVEDLNLTTNTQPLMLIAGVALYRAWASLGGLKPALLAGHSLGEYTALVIAEALNFDDALALIYFRAQAMQQAVPEGMGGMAAIIGLNDETIHIICHEITDNGNGELLEAANFNSPGQIVIAGHRTAILKGIEMAKLRGAKRAIVLPMSIPSHCSLMKPAAESMRKKLDYINLQPPKIAILHNADVRRHADIASIKEALVHQLVNPVRWVDTIHALTSEGITHVIECGPGKILTGLNKRIDQNLQHLSLTNSKIIKQAIKSDEI